MVSTPGDHLTATLLQQGEGWHNELGAISSERGVVGGPVTSSGSGANFVQP